jgi:hypothetical protein
MRPRSPLENIASACTPESINKNNKGKIIFKVFRDAVHGLNTN